MDESRITAWFVDGVGQLDSGCFESSTTPGSFHHSFIALVLHNMETSIERLPQVVSYRNSPKSLNDP